MAGKYRLISQLVTTDNCSDTAGDGKYQRRERASQINPQAPLICHKCNGFIDRVIIVFCMWETSSHSHLPTFSYTNAGAGWDNVNPTSKVLAFCFFGSATLVCFYVDLHFD